MIKIAPENLNFQINTTGIDLSYSETEGLSIRLTIIKNEEAATATISFSIVAEFECIGMNFYEAQYENIAIELPAGTTQDSAFYKNTDLSSYEHKIKIYDPRNRFELAEYYIPGNDCYLRIIASKYKLHINEN
ncbi:hypothetical protein [Paracidovorax avenae]|uniref:hypothetical protein n=1 Tax=Paracidovorax avenae TaxID=80867 RepID=UPI00126036F0|nr:hypothetical protein [Paracidovorax avenae]